MRIRMALACACDSVTGGGGRRLLAGRGLLRVRQTHGQQEGGGPGGPERVMPRCGV